jgi:putative ABC transport system permease protein
MTAMSPQLMDDSVLPKIETASRQPGADVAAAAPYLYVVAHAGAGQDVVVAGTWLDQTQRLEPSWKLEGEWIKSRDDLERCLAGANVARQLQLGPGSRIELSYGDRTASLAVAGIASAGGTEDNQILANLPVVQRLAGLAGRVEVVQVSVSGSAKEIAARASRFSAALPGLEVRPLRQITEAEGQLLERIRLLILLMVVLILALTVLCVLATMAALAMERRADVGLMKALGGSISRVVSLFLAEVGVLGALGGFLGYFAGMALARWMGQRVFGAAISARLEVLPLTVALMVGVALAGALPLRLLGRVRPAVILRGE